MVVSIRLWHVFGLSIESVESQPVYGYVQDETEEEATIYFFDGFVINVPFIKIMIGDVYGLVD